MTFQNSAGVMIEVSESAFEELKNRFREEMRPFGLDDWVSSLPSRIVESADGRLLVEVKTAMLPIWYPKKLQELERAGYDVRRKLKRYVKQPPCEMYWVQKLYEIGG